MSFSSYMEVNILIDMFLIIILTFLVLPRSPKLYVAILLLNVAQYAVIIPQDPSGTAPIQFSWSGGPSDPEADVYEDQHRLPASNPLELVGRAQSAFSVVSAAMGSSGVSPQPADFENNAAHDTSSSSTRNDSSNTPSRRVTFEWQAIMMAAIHDPHAMWLGIRLFWLAAAFMLFIQRPLFGMAAACSNLIPVPLLVTVGPYIYHQFNRQEAVQRANAAMDNPETLKEFVIQFATSNGLAVLLLAIVILGCIALVQRRQTLKQLKRLESFLDSSRYRAELNGTEYEFAVDHNILMVNGLRFNVDTMRPESQTSNKWFIKPHNTLVFILKEDPQSAASGPCKPSYSYKRKS